MKSMRILDKLLLQLQYPQALLGESAQVRNIGCMMALPECDIQVIFNQKRQSIWHDQTQFFTFNRIGIRTGTTSVS